MGKSDQKVEGCIGDVQVSHGLEVGNYTRFVVKIYRFLHLGDRQNAENYRVGEAERSQKAIEKSRLGPSVANLLGSKMKGENV